VSTPGSTRLEASPPRARTRVVVSPRPGEPATLADPNVHGDPSALGQMMTGPDLPAPPHFPTAADLDPAPPDPEPCPMCGQPRSNAVNRFATGTRGDASLHVPAREPEEEPEGGEAA
jgi:hypothetical protein